ncbi:MAG: DUF4358 domain-containing protein [Eubacterium sp.]|nr:DUF4358 domain-containing protein [Eubacterium sp.]
MKCKRFTALLMAAAVSIGAFSINAYAPAAYFESLGANAPVITAQAASPSAAALAKEVRKAYEGGYLPDYKLSKDEIKTRYGVDSSLYSSAFVQIPMISTRIDEITIFKAKDSASKKKILEAVKQYQKKLKTETMQYPSNLKRIQGSRVYQKGKYVCFFMMGDISKSVEESGSDEAIIKAYQEQNKKAVNAVKNKLK